MVKRVLDLFVGMMLVAWYAHLNLHGSSNSQVLMSILISRTSATNAARIYNDCLSESKPFDTSSSIRLSLLGA